MEEKDKLKQNMITHRRAQSLMTTQKERSNDDFMTSNKYM